MTAIIYSIFFVLLWSRYKSQNGTCVGTWLLLWYAIASILTLLEFYINPINNDTLDGQATLYYVFCQVIALFPFLLLARYDCRHFYFNKRLLSYLAFVLILFGAIQFINSIVFIINNFSVFIYNIAQIRDSFYDTMLVSSRITAFEKLSIIINNMQYMSPFLAFYFLGKGDKRLAVWLFIISLSAPLSQIVHGEREGTLKFLVNLIACFIFFRPVLSNDVKKKVRKAMEIIATPFVIYIIAMTVGRFMNYGDNSILDSLFLYGGDQPFYFSRIFNDNNILNQLQYGRVNFQYFFPAIERVQGQINLYINSDFYLNQFGGMPGSFFLDFGYNSIFIISIFSVLYCILISKSKKKGARYPMSLVFLFYFSFQVLYMNIFYFDFFDLFGILFTVVFFIVCLVYPGSNDCFDVETAERNVSVEQ